MTTKTKVNKFPFLSDSVNSVIFLLSYPYSEEYSQPTQYMNTRCPAWCDRVLMSQTAQKFIEKVRHYCIYNLDLLFSVR